MGSSQDLDYQIAMLLNRDDISEGDLPIPGRVRRKILIVRQQSRFFATLADRLADSFKDDFSIKCASSIEEALSVLSCQKFSLIALDPSLPDASGLDGARALQDYLDVPLVMIAEREDRDLALKALNFGVDDYIVAGRAESNNVEMIGRALLYSIERRRADRLERASLKLEKLAIRDMLEHAPIMTARVDKGFLIRDCNTSFAESAGSDQQEMKGRCLLDVIPDLADVEMFTSVLSGGSPFSGRLPIRRLNQRQDLDLTWDIYCWPVERSMSKTKEALIIAVDVSKETRLEADRDEFVASLAHEVRNPLYGQVQVLEALMRKSPDNEVQETLGLLRDGARDLLNLLDDLMGTYALGSNHSETSELVDIERLLEKQLEAIRILGGLSGKDVRVRKECELQPIPVDRIKLQRVLANLLHNALKFSDPKSLIVVTLGMDGSHLHCSVCNQASSTDSSSLEHLFTRFSSSSQPHSSGFGLYLTRKLLGSMGGSIEARSDRQGEITFSVRLPTGTKRTG
ncbi:MAG: response regulator [Candidatus Melainabacteria bacterium]|nr:response regulator [Candidatus Melainabacteria bacterium]